MTTKALLYVAVVTLCVGVGWAWAGDESEIDTLYGFQAGASLAVNDHYAAFIGYQGVDVSEADGRRSGILLRADLLSVAANPDLTVQWNYLKQTCKTSDTTKCKINGSFIIQNTGNQKAGSSSIDFYLSDDDQYDGGDTFLERISTGPINAGKSVVKKLIYRLPAGESASGKYIIAVIDPEDVVTELDESNNEVPFPTSCPDLVICMIAQFFSQAVNVGSIPTSTCYEFWSGCKPWNCEGDTTNQKYWDRECWNRFPNECTRENNCRAAYPLW